MKISLKPLKQQVIVITGATSGIGLATAREAAKRGARLVLAGRNHAALNRLVDELKAQGAEAIAVAADVGRQEDHQKILDAGITAYGGIETWVNNAGVSIFGKVEDVAIEDQRQLFETNFWGVVYGSLASLRHLRQMGGALINIGSEVSDRAVPLQGIYSASKHAVKGFTDALRMELEADGAPVSVTLIKPASIDTAFIQHAKNYLDVEPQLPPPIYSAKAVADAILYAAEHPIRDVYVGGASRAISALGQRMPGVADKVLGPSLIKAQRSSQPANPRNDALWGAGDGPQQDTYTEGRVHQSSLYTDLNTRWKGLMWAGMGLTVALAAMKGASKSRRRI